MSNQPIVCIAWFEANQWEKLIEVSIDSSSLGETYEVWRNNAETMIEKMQSGGMILQKIQVEVDELVEWAKRKGVPIDGKARSEFAIQTFARLESRKN